VVSLVDWPGAAARLLREAKRAGLEDLPEAALARWLFCQAHLLVSTPVEAVADALFAAGHAREGDAGRLAYGPLLVPPVDADERLFQEPELPRTKRSSDFGLFAMSSPAKRTSDAPAAASFGDLGLRPELLEGLRLRRIQAPSSLQQRCLGPLLGDGDVVVEAPPGTGKTLALALAALQRVDFALAGEGPPAPHCPEGHEVKRGEAEGASCAGCGPDGGAAPRPRPQGEQGSGPCETCGCWAERDEYGDRVCWCDACEFRGGCWRREAGEGESHPAAVLCPDCGWYLCGPCSAAAPCPTRPARVPACQALILVPTRELAIQIRGWVTSLGKPLGARCEALIGGTSVRASINAVRHGRHVVVGNPGRVFDLISKRHLRVDSVRDLFLDEADAMLSHGMKNQLYDIFKCLPFDVTVRCFATRLPEDILELLPKFMRDPVYVMNRGEAAEPWIPARVRHYCMAGGAEKAGRLLGLRGMLLGACSTLVFCNSRRGVDDLVEQLHRLDQPGVAALHAELDQRERELVMREFLQGKARTVVCTGEFARGLDNSRVNLVINVDLPRGEEDYLLRSGRCGRFDRPGTVITLVAHQEVQAIHALALRYGMRLEASTMREVSEALRRRPGRRASAGEGAGGNCDAPGGGPDA